MSATSRNAPSSATALTPNRHSANPFDAAQTDRAGLDGHARQAPIGSARLGGRLTGKVALVTGGERGIGRAAAVAFAKEGADIMLVYLDDHHGARITRAEIEREGRRCETLSLDMGREANAIIAVEQAIAKLEHLDILVNTATEQPALGTLADISAEHLEQTFRSHLFAMFYLCKAAVPHLSRGARIINTASAHEGAGGAALLDHASTKGAVVAFTQSLALALAHDGILVNGVAPTAPWAGNPSPAAIGAVAAPVNHAGSSARDGSSAWSGHAEDVAGCYVFLASDDAAHISGQVLYPSGGIR